tara:strand:- start:6260 stop:6475 length:216 start_codon:yes stop_codon:yes gene_type:complete
MITPNVAGFHFSDAAAVGAERMGRSICLGDVDDAAVETPKLGVSTTNPSPMSMPLSIPLVALTRAFLGLRV